MTSLKETLWALGTCDQTIMDLRREQGKIPEAISDGESKARAAREVVESERRTLEAAEHTRRVKEGELQDCEAQSKKFQAQAPMVKTNQEYSALMHEIDTVTERISQIEEEILLAMEEADQVSTRLTTVEREQGELERGFAHQVEQLRERLEWVQKELGTRAEEHEGLVSFLPPEVQDRYLRVRDRLGTGTAWIQGETCGACHYRIPPEWVNRVLRGEIHSCGSCHRILVLGEE